MKETFRRPFLHRFSPASLLYVSGGNCHRALVDESEIVTKYDVDVQWIRNGTGARFAVCTHPTKIKREKYRITPN
jgi:hypothetical protein